MNRLFEKWKKKSGHVTEWDNFWNSITGKEGLRVLIEEARSGTEPTTIESSALECAKRRGMDRIVNLILDMSNPLIEKPSMPQPFDHIGLKQKKG